MTPTLSAITPTPIRNAWGVVRCPTSNPKFMPKNPVRKVSGRNTEATTVSCAIVPSSRFETVDR